MVCAICGRMPLMMQSAPIKRAAATVLIRCCATNVSTVGTPVMSMMAISAPGVTISSSRLSMTVCVRALSSVPINGRARMPSHNRTTGVDNSSSSCCWRPMMSSRLFWTASTVYSPSLSSSNVAIHISCASLSGSLPIFCRNNVKSGSLKENTKVAVSDGVRPSVACERETSSSTVRLWSHAGAVMSANCPAATPARKAASKRREVSVSSALLIRPLRSAPDFSWDSIQSWSRACSFSASNWGMIVGYSSVMPPPLALYDAEIS